MTNTDSGSNINHVYRLQYTGCLFGEEAMKTSTPIKTDFTVPGQRPTLRDVARSLNVSHTTVSRVLNGQGADFISAETRARVIEAARAMRYRPNRAARTLATGKTGFISLWIGDLFHPYYARTMQHVSREIEGSGYETVVFHVRNGSVSPTTLFTAADGLLTLDWAGVVDSYLEYETHPLPLVSMGLDCTRRADYVAIDLYPGAVEAVQHLVETGRRRIVYLTHSESVKSNEPRFRAYKDVMAQAGLAPEVMETEINNRPKCREDVSAYVTERGSPDAFFCLSDDMAMGTYRALCDLKRRVPEDVAIVGCDGIEEAEYLEKPLSTISLPIPEMCRIATDFLLRRIADPTLPQQEAVLQPTLLRRESSQI
ncbi:MAG: LacI family DNA-binding transcriptional regulator [Fibrella sp.]|nr:LacI family DNA-binding transcriptional regulator [Armatimonadota bacterium]